MTKKLKISVIHGPNLNLLGKREPAIYGTTTLQEINHSLKKIADCQNVGIVFFQSNHEGAIIDFIQKATDSAGFVINPAAYTHTSIAIRDSLLAVGKPFVEVHLSNPKKREKFRQTSYYSDKAVAVVAGHGAKSYETGLRKLLQHLKK